MRYAALFSTLAVLATSSASPGRAQVTNTSTGIASPSGAPTGNTPQSGGARNSPGLGTTTNTTNPTPEFQRPVFISGKVMMDDGSPVPSNVTIQRVCSGSARSVAYTDSKGRFSFQWGQANSGIIANASEAGFGGRDGGTVGYGGAQSSGAGNPLSAGNSGQSATQQMWGCELRAEVAGYRSELINLTNRNSLDNPDVGVIVLRRLANVEGSAISATSYMAPKEAQKAFERGMQLVQKNKPEDAARDFEKAVAAYPKYAVAWVSLGKLRLQQKAVEPAREAFQKAIDADGKLVTPYVELGFLAAQEQKWDVSAQYLDKAVKLDPIDFPQAWYVDAVANFNLKKFDEAAKCAREAMKLDTRHVNPKAGYLLALALIEKHEYPEASAELKSYMKIAQNTPDFDKVKDQSDRLEKFLAESQEPARQD